MADPTPDPLPSALSQLFTDDPGFLPDSPFHPALRAEVDPDIDAADAADDAAVAEAAVAVAAAAEQAQEGAQTPEQPHTQEDKMHAYRDGTPLRDDTDRQANDSFSALGQARLSLRDENERLRRIIAVLEPGPSENDVPAGEQEIAQSTLRELASAAVDTTLAAFSLESLHQLDAMVSDGSTANAADFLHGLVVPVTSGGRMQAFDPFVAARASVEADIAATRSAIEAKEAEIAAAKLSPGNGGVLDRGYEAQLHRASTAIEGAKVRAKVLADVLVRTKQARDDVKLDLDTKEAQLAELCGDDREAGMQAIAQVRAYLDHALRDYKEKGVLPSIPLPPLPPVATPTQPPPSSLPKKRGRPPRSAPRNTVVPPQLLHLVPDSASVQARAQDTPLRRKGIKRNKVELEREKRREEEEGEMLRNLAGMGVWRQYEDDE